MNKETEVLLIAGSIMINSACVLIANGADTFESYALSRILVAIGAGLMAMDLVLRFLAFAKRAKAGQMCSPHLPSESGVVADSVNLLRNVSNQEWGK